MCRDHAVLTCHYWSEQYIDYNSLVPELYKLLKKRLKLWNLNPQAQRPLPRRRRFDRFSQYDQRPNNTLGPQDRGGRTNAPMSQYQHPQGHAPRQSRPSRSPSLHINDMARALQAYQPSPMPPISQSMMSPNGFMFAPPNMNSSLISPNMGSVQVNLNPFIAMAAQMTQNSAYAAYSMSQSRSPGDGGGNNNGNNGLFVPSEQMQYGQMSPQAAQGYRQLELGPGRDFLGRAHDVGGSAWSANMR